MYGNYVETIILTFTSTQHFCQCEEMNQWWECEIYHGYGNKGGFGRVQTQITQNLFDCGQLENDNSV